MTRRQDRSGSRPPRTSLYPQAVRLGLVLRWLVVLGAAAWLYLAAGYTTARGWGLAAAAVYATTLTVLALRDRHPWLSVVGAIDTVAVGAIVLVWPGPARDGLFLFGLPILVLTLAYGWPGMGAALAGYVLVESGELVLQSLVPADLWEWFLRGLVLAIGGVIVASLVERHEDLKRSLRRASSRDPLTGLSNRQSFLDSLERLHRLAVRRGTSYSILVLSLRRAEAGARDADWWSRNGMLRRACEAARGALRTTDLIARVDRNQLAVALPDAELEDARLVARKMLDRIRAGTEGLLVDVGAADMRPTRRDAFEDALATAYKAMRQAMNDGGGALIAIPARSAPPA